MTDDEAPDKIELYDDELSRRRSRVRETMGNIQKRYSKQKPRLYADVRDQIAELIAEEPDFGCVLVLL